MLQKENFFIFDDYVCLIKAVTTHGYIQEVEIFIKFLYSRYWITIDLMNQGEAPEWQQSLESEMLHYCPDS